MNKLTAKAIVLCGVMASGHAAAVPWCHGGTIVEVANVTWSGDTTVAMASVIPAPPSVVDPDRYQVFHATSNFCQGYAGGGGPIWGNPVSGAGSVRTIITGPFILTNTVNNYDLSMGVSFKCEKCYTLPPYEEVRDYDFAAPMAGTEGKTQYEVFVPDRE